MTHNMHDAKQATARMRAEAAYLSQINLALARSEKMKQLGLFFFSFLGSRGLTVRKDDINDPR
jgi:hypothetical protein